MKREREGRKIKIGTKRMARQQWKTRQREGYVARNGTDGVYGNVYGGRGIHLWQTERLAEEEGRTRNGRTEDAVWEVRAWLLVARSTDGRAGAG
jgi:hypothetical protein